MKAYHKTFGEIEVLIKDNTTTTIVVLATGEEKKLLNKFADMLISDKPFTKAKKVVDEKKELTEEDKDFLSSIQGKLRWLDKKSTENYRSGRYGAY